jgi:hypothetical protein
MHSNCICNGKGNIVKVRRDVKGDYGDGATRRQWERGDWGI